jgi:hypothetical protein
MGTYAETADPWVVLRRIAALSATPGDETPPAAAGVARVRGDLLRPERRIVVAGAFKTGKSALVNALLGAPIVPVRARQPSRRVVEIGHGDAPAALIHSAHGTTDIPFDTARDAIVGGEADDMVEMRVPAPLLASGCALIDTPGLGEDPAASAVVLAAVERADLAIVVLAADKILSAAERAAAAEITALLAGNVIYAVNRLDLIDAEDRAEILEWARTVLASSGNALVGRPRIFGTIAGGPDRARGADELRVWLAGVAESGLMDRIAAVSRLARLQRAASAAATALGTDAAAVRARADSLRQRHDAQVARRREEIAGEMGGARTGLTDLLSHREEQGSSFVDRCVEDTAVRLEVERGAVPLQVRGAMHAWVENITASVHDILATAPVSAPPFSLEDWIVRIQVERPADTPDAIGGQVGEAITRIFDGGKAGRETGSAIGSWIGKTVLGVDAGAEQRKRVEQVARSLLPSLRAETQRYLASVAVLLDEAERYYASREEPDPEVSAAEEAADRAATLYHWAGTLVQESAAHLSALSCPLP